MTEITWHSTEEARQILRSIADEESIPTSSADIDRIRIWFEGSKPRKYFIEKLREQVEFSANDDCLLDEIAVGCRSRRHADGEY